MRSCCRRSGLRSIRAATSGTFGRRPGRDRSHFFVLTEEPKHQPNDNRIAFWAENRAEVDRIAEVVRQAGGLNLEGPALWREYSPGYYAVFFEDPSGNKLEVCCRQSLTA